MKKEWETPSIQKLSFSETEGGSTPSEVEISIYKTGS